MSTEQRQLAKSDKDSTGEIEVLDLCTGIDIVATIDGDEMTTEDPAAPWGETDDEWLDTPTVHPPLSETEDDSMFAKIVHPQVSEAVRYLLDRQAMHSDDDMPRTIAVVSALRGEGVTTVSESLAEVLSLDFGYSVCLLDLSWTSVSSTGSPGIFRRLGRRLSRSSPEVSQAPGLLNVLSGEATVTEAITTDRTGQRAYLRAGSTATPVRAITRGQKFEEIFDELENRFDVLVFDSSPVAENSTALALVQRAEAYVFVTRQSSTSLSQVRDSIELLEPLPSLGAILNAHRNRVPGFIRRLLSS